MSSEWYAYRHYNIHLTKSVTDKHTSQSVHIIITLLLKYRKTIKYPLEIYTLSSQVDSLVWEQILLVTTSTLTRKSEHCWSWYHQMVLLQGKWQQHLQPFVSDPLYNVNIVQVIGLRIRYTLIDFLSRLCTYIWSRHTVDSWSVHSGSLVAFSLQ